MIPIRKMLAGGTIVAATLGGGALGAALVNTGAGAQEAPATTDGTTTEAPAQAPAGTPADRPAGPHQANGITETPLTGSDAEKAKAAALEAVPGATVDRVETDADGDAYEAHLRKADGTCATVKMDKSFKVTSVEEGGPGGGHGPRGGAPDTATSDPAA